ncbi:MAG: cation:proton antiporter [Anaerolineaceae bacterium]
MSETLILINITLAMVVALLGGILARRIGLPTIVGYLLAGIVISPFTPGVVGDIHTLEQLAELGVIFLMFGVGLHFSFKQLWAVRGIAIPGALIQTAIATVLGALLSSAWGWSLSAGIVLGLSISVASTVVLLRGLMSANLLESPHGQAAVGWLVMEDILSVLILVILPALAPSSGSFSWTGLGITLAKAVAFVVLMYFVGTRFIPWILERVAHTHSRELFILVVLAITLGTAVGASELFGVSLALGAFVAGAIISQSHLSSQVGADIFSFREAFSVLFFVSVGMLVNPVFLWKNIGQAAELTLLVVAGKFLIVLLMGLFFKQSMRTFLVIAVGLSQIGEFSFIIGQAGVAIKLLSADQYSLILAVSLLSIIANPFMFKLLPVFEKVLMRIPAFSKRMEVRAAPPRLLPSPLTDHVVIAGYSRVGKHLSEVLKSLGIPVLVIESDIETYDQITHSGIQSLYGDASNSEVLKNAQLKDAKALVLALTDETTTSLSVASARDISPDLPIIACSFSEEGIDTLSKLGATTVVEPILESGLELVHHTLLQLGFPLREVHEYTEAVRRDHYNTQVTTDEEHRTLHELLHAFKGIDISWITLESSSPLVGRSLSQVNLRSITGASVVTLIRDSHLTANPKSATVFEAGDRIGFIGDEAQIASARKMIEGVEETDSSG